MTPCWLALCDVPTVGAIATTAYTDVLGEVGLLVAFEADDEPVPGAVKVDPRAIDPEGVAGWVSLVLAPQGAWLLFDDPAVSAAMRAVLGGPPMDVASTLVTGDDRFVGSILGIHGDAAERLQHDPFNALFPRRLLRVDAGLLGRTPPPVGPGIQRYGAANPWPWDRFPDAEGSRG